jgi:antitoxin CptB
MVDLDQGGSSENRRKCLLFRAQRRGFKEVDLIFGAYADAELARLDEAGLDQFEALLTAPDQDVYAWLRGAKPVPAEYDNVVFAGLKAVCGQQSPRWNS